MAIHHISWKSTASGVEDEYIHAEALSWLVGDEDAVQIERMNSYHGSPVHLITAEINRRGKATKSLSRLGKNTLEQIKSKFGKLIDEDNVIHIRLDLHDLLAGKITLTTPGDRPTIKGRAKLEIYPGNDLLDIAHSTFETAINGALN